QLVHEFIRRDEDNNVESITTALNHVDLDVEEGQFIAILGHNGSGKSTLAKHINALLAPSEGTIWVDEMDVSEEENIIPVRKTAGMVFQNPDNQIVASVVEEDVGFGPENISVPTEEIIKRVNHSLEAVGMTKYRAHSPNKLSGGQKQRVAIAGVVAMEPKCIVFDEPTAMLDPNGRKEIIKTAHELNREKGVTVLLITHYMEEVVDADYVYVMEKGQIVMQGNPRELFSRVDELKSYRLDVPQMTWLADNLRKAGLQIPAGILSREELVESLMQIVRRADMHMIAQTALPEWEKAVQNEEAQKVFPGEENAEEDFAKSATTDIILDHVSYCYSQDTAYQIQALKDINLTLKKGQFIGIIGHTGSGKSTLVQHLNGLLKATEGHIYVGGEDIYDNDYDMRKLRGKVGLVFQYPEYQLFETTVFEDVCFGPKNQGLDKKEVELRAFEALRNVHFPEELFFQPPFDMSGGQKRRAAIAGVLAMKPDVLILDEPTAGLDPAGRDEILDLIAGMHRELGITVILVSHSMEDVAQYVERIIVMNQGSVMFDEEPKEVFRHYRELEQVGLAAPQVTYLMHDLQERGLDVDLEATTVTQATAAILRAI
ncbi:MAG: energy-coupling factor transporter ATPase, partial [Lachnospiraceae bacterium]|nr:energy-coupling factor transporter ATPase [Lachnospiraceae bacterium]